MPTTEQIIEALRPVEDPELRRSIVALGMVRDVDLRSDGTVGVLIALTVTGCPLRQEIEHRVSSAVRPLEGVTGVELDFTVMTDEEREALRIRLHGDPAATAGATAAHGHAEGRQIPFAQPGSRTRPVLIASARRSPVQRHDQPRRRARQQGALGGHHRPDVYGFSIPACSAPTASRS
jgi:ATP-binding protein involved in chromosome partitioning